IYSLLPEGGGGDKFFFQMLGVVALIVASLCAFFLKEPTGGHGESEVHYAPEESSVYQTGVNRN
ncbi:MAG: MFS transporter, partial [Cyanobacteria bacterium P01_E01_bin.35]